MTEKLDSADDVAVFNHWPDPAILRLGFLKSDPVVASNGRTTRFDLVDRHESVNICNDCLHTAQF